MCIASQKNLMCINKDITMHESIQLLFTTLLETSFEHIVWNYSCITVSCILGTFHYQMLLYFVHSSFWGKSSESTWVNMMRNRTLCADYVAPLQPSLVFAPLHTHTFIPLLPFLMILLVMPN